VSAQHYKWDATVFGGYSWLNGNLFDRNDFDFFNDGIVDDDIFDNDFGRDIGLGNGGNVGAQLGYWFNKRWGLRANFMYTASDVSRPSLFFDGIDDNLLLRPFTFFDHDVNIWNGTGDLMIRLNTPRTRWDGFEWLPYVALGLGATWINPAGHEFNLVDDFPLVVDGDIVDRGGRDVIPLRCTTVLDVDLLFDSCAVLEKHTEFTGLLGLGMDLRFSPNFGVRLEFGDKIWDAPVRQVALDRDFPFLFREIGDLGGTINQLYLTAGLTYMFGLVHPPVRAAVVPRPAPPPPPPPPATEEITVCVVDPTYAQGLRTITATRNLSTGDTTVMKNGQKMPLAEAVGNVPVAGNATWYVSGAPLEIGLVTSPKIQYVSVGGARNIEAGELAYIGTVNGIPVFADRLTLAPGLANLGPNTDLNQLIATSPDARKALETVAVIYVPLQPTGCVFQAMQKQQEIRKK
jgi:hypothetical protein